MNTQLQTVTCPTTFKMYSDIIQIIYHTNNIQRSLDNTLIRRHNIMLAMKQSDLILNDLLNQTRWLLFGASTVAAATTAFALFLHHRN